MKTVRKMRGLSVEELAKRLNVGASTVRKIEANTERRADRATIGELFAFAAAMNVAPVHLLAPFEGGWPVELPSRDQVWAGRLRTWIKCGWPLREDDDPREFFRTVPPDEFEEKLVQAARRAPDEATPADQFYLPDAGALDQALDHRDDRWTLEPHRDREGER